MTTFMSLAELESETVELLPARETLCSPQHGENTSASTTNFGILNDSLNGNQVLTLFSTNNSNQGAIALG